MINGNITSAWEKYNIFYVAHQVPEILWDSHNQLQPCFYNKTAQLHFKQMTLCLTTHQLLNYQIQIIAQSMADWWQFKSARKYFSTWAVIIIQCIAKKSYPWRFLQRCRTACNAKRCNSYGNSVCLSVSPSHAGTVSRWMKVRSCKLHCEVAKTL